MKRIASLTVLWMSFLFSPTSQAQSVGPILPSDPEASSSAPINTDPEEARQQRQNQLFLLGLYMSVGDVCTSEVAQLCTIENITPTCLVDKADELSACCASQIHDQLGVGKPKETLSHKSMMLPRGSELLFNSDCGYSRVKLPRRAPYKLYMLAPGTIQFSPEGVLEYATLIGDQMVHDLPLAADQPLTRFHPSGTPQQVRLKENTEVNGITYAPMMISEHQKNQNQKISLDEWSDFGWFSHSHEGYDSGFTALHPNGRVARGNLLKVTEIDRLKFAPGVTHFSESGKVISGELVKGNQYKSLLLAAGPVKFSESGVLQEARLAAGADLGIFKTPSPGFLEFTETGEMKSVRLMPKENSSFYIKLNDLVISPNDTLHLYPDGRLKRLTVRDHTGYRGVAYPRFTELQFSKTGDVLWDSYTNPSARKDERRDRQQADRLWGWELETLKFSQVRNDVLLPKNTLMITRSSSKSNIAVLPRSTTYDGLILAAGAIELHPYNSGIGTAYLDTPQYINGLLMSAYPHKISYHNRDSFSSGTLAEDSLIGGVLYADQHEISYPPNSTTIRRATLAEDTEFNGVVIKKLTEVSFDESGKLLSGQLATNSKIEGIDVPASSVVTFYNGKLSNIESPTEVMIENYKLDGRAIRVRENGLLRTGVFAVDTMVAGTLVNAHTQILFDDDGNLIDKKQVRKKWSPRDDGVLVIVAENLLPMSDAPTKPFCRKAINEKGRAAGFSLGEWFQSQCKRYYEEFRD